MQERIEKTNHHLEREMCGFFLLLLCKGDHCSVEKLKSSPWKLEHKILIVQPLSKHKTGN